MGEARISTVELRVDTFDFRLDSFREELTNDSSALHNEITEVGSSCQRSLQTNQQVILQHADNLKEATVQQCLSIQEVVNKVDYDLMQMPAKCDGLREECNRDCKAACSELDGIISNRYLESASVTSQQINALVEAMKADNERRLHEAHEHIDELRIGFTEERNVQLKAMEETLRSQCFFQIRDQCAEERANARKLFQQHLRSLELERDARLKLATDMRADLVKAIAKEREERLEDNSLHRSEMTQALREWKLLKSNGGTSTAVGPSSNAGPGNSPTGSYFNSMRPGFG